MKACRRVMKERDGSDAVTQQYTHENYLGEPWTLDNRSGGITVAELNNGLGSQRHFYHCNTLYSTFALTDETGAIAEGYQYDAYGRTIIMVGLLLNVSPRQEKPTGPLQTSPFRRGRRGENGLQ